jgi:hypothetical protein
MMDRMLGEWQAWEAVRKELEVLAIDIYHPRSRPLVRAIRLWGELLHELRASMSAGEARARRLAAASNYDLPAAVRRYRL